MSQSNSQSKYRIYLLTVWHEPMPHTNEGAEWRLQLADPHTGRRYGFTKPEELLAALQQLSGDASALNGSAWATRQSWIECDLALGAGEVVCLPEERIETQQAMEQPVYLPEFWSDMGSSVAPV